MTFDEMRRKYENDPAFYQAVNYIYHLLSEGHLLVSELRDAAMFAGYKFESEKIHRLPLSRKASQNESFS